LSAPDLVFHRRRASRLREAAASVPYWFHSIDLGHGVTTPGEKSAEHLRRELEQLRLPDLHGKTFLDVGAWDGYFSFAAERLGADRVVALDPYAWPHAHERGFQVARAALASKVESVVADFMTVDLEELGSFDVVLFAGVLYHLEDPLGALRRLAAITRGLAVIETEAIAARGFEGRALCEFYEGGQLNNDPTNWWAPNAKGLEDLCRAAGFAAVEIVATTPWSDEQGFERGRLVVHARKT
jgi:tRNA (mo5U34)-methyltransferase